MDKTEKNIIKINKQKLLIEKYKKLIENENKKIIDITNLKIFDNNTIIQNLKNKLKNKRSIKIIIYK